MFYGFSTPAKIGCAAGKGKGEASVSGPAGVAGPAGEAGPGLSTLEVRRPGTAHASDYGSEISLARPSTRDGPRHVPYIRRMRRSAISFSSSG